MCEACSLPEEGQQAIRDIIQIIKERMDKENMLRAAGVDVNTRQVSVHIPKSTPGLKSDGEWAYTTIADAGSGVRSEVGLVVIKIPNAMVVFRVEDLTIEGEASTPVPTTHE